MPNAKQKYRFLKYYFFLLIWFPFPTFLFSQISVSQSEFLKVFTPGNPLYAVPGESGSINVGNREGPNIYDFSFVGSENEFLMNNYEVSQIPELSGRYPSNASTFGEALAIIDGNPVFYSVSDSTFLLGDVTIGDQNNYVHYDPYELFSAFPLNYGDLPQEQPVNVYDTTFNSTGQAISTYYYPDFVDVETYGYGTLKLPGRELECLRMIRRYSWFQFKEFFFITKEGVLIVVSDVALTEPDTGYVEGEFIVLSSDPITGIEEISVNIPIEFKLIQNYPNPFNPQTVISYQLSMISDVDLSVFNILGQKVTTLISEKQQPGSYKVEWNADNFAAGVYYYQLKSENFQEVKKMMLIN